MGMKVAEGPAVGHHMTFKSPFRTKDIFKKEFASTSGFTIDPIVSPHKTH
jgi:hypothetical protein